MMNAEDEDEDEDEGTTNGTKGTNGGSRLKAGLQDGGGVE
jgi:hypothetical protein